MEDYYDEPDMTVDRAEVVQINGKWYVKGYRDGLEVVTMGGWDTQDGHVNAVLYNSDGIEVAHEVVETLDPVEFLRGFIAAFED